MDSASMAAMTEFVREYQGALASSVESRQVLVADGPVAASADSSSTDDTTQLPSDKDSEGHRTATPIHQQDEQRARVAPAAGTGIAGAAGPTAEHYSGSRQRAGPVAVLQREWRLLAEKQQKQLKTAVLTRAKVIHRVTELLRHCLLNGETESVDLLEGQTQKKQASLFVTFMNELDTLYAQTDYVVGGVDFASSPPETYRFNREWNKDMTFLETSSATVIPLNFAHTSPAFSALVLAPGYDLEIQDDDNTAARAYHLDFSKELGYNATLQIYLTLRRYVEAERVVIVWRGLAEGRGEYKDLYMDESGWFILSPVSPRDGEEPATLLQTCIRLLPIGFDLESDADARANRFVKLRMRADEADVNDMEQMMAKLMLGKSQLVVS